MLLLSGRRFQGLTCAVILTLLLAGCSEGKKGKKREGVTAEKERLPDYVLNGVTHAYYEEGALRLQVVFEKGAYYNGQQELSVENCTYIYYDTKGNILSRGRSKRATLFSDRSRLVAEDDVVIVSELNGFG